jgi:type I protein arginine methyltransferase
MPQFDLGEVMGAPASVTSEISESDSESSTSDPLDLARDEGWEDVEPDFEKVMVQSLFDDKAFTDVRSMLEHCKQAFDFDFMKIRAELGVYVCQTLTAATSQHMTSS